MIKSMRTVICILLLASITIAEADVYKWVAPDGSIVYTDRSLHGAAKIPIPAWRPPVPVPLSISPEFKRPAPTVAVRSEYDGIRVRKPRPGAHVREEGNGLEVVVDLEPKLEKGEGHRIQILLDGQPKGDATPSQTRRLLDIYPGQHTVAARVLTAEGRVMIESRPVTFFYRRPQSFTSAPFFHRPQGPVKAAPWARPAPMAPRAFNVPPRPGSPGGKFIPR
jgi:hypothetical protein